MIWPGRVYGWKDRFSDFSRQYVDRADTFIQKNSTATCTYIIWRVPRMLWKYNGEKAYSQYNTKSKNQNTLISDTWQGSHAGNEIRPAPSCVLSALTRSRLILRALIWGHFSTIYLYYFPPQFFNRHYVYLNFLFLLLPEDKQTLLRVLISLWIIIQEWSYWIS